MAGKTVVLTTTNGVRAMFHARQAENVLIGAFVNATAVLRRLLGQERVHLLCAGTDGQFSEDDILLAGMLVERLRSAGRDGIRAKRPGHDRPRVLAAQFRPAAGVGGGAAAGGGRWPSNWPRAPAAGTSSTSARADDLLTAAQIDRFQVRAAAGRAGRSHSPLLTGRRRQGRKSRRRRPRHFRQTR